MLRLIVMPMVVALCLWAVLPSSSGCAATGDADSPGSAALDASSANTPALGSGLRGVFYNPVINGASEYPWLLHYTVCRERVRADLEKMSRDANLNLLDFF